jgi:HPt (histidine-containing phosphotransfer) domain-containing protein
MDTGMIEQLRHNHGDAFLREILDMFLSDAPELLAEIDRYYQTGAYDDLSRAAHKLRGMGLSLGLAEISEPTAAIEHFARDRNHYPLLSEPVRQLQTNYLGVAQTIQTLFY